MFWLTIPAFVIVALVLAVALVRTFDPGRSYLRQFFSALDDLFFPPGPRT